MHITLALHAYSKCLNGYRQSNKYQNDQAHNPSLNYYA